MFLEEELIPISILQHYSFCPRQVALIHIEQLWEDNLFTAQGDELHERIDIVHYESRKKHKIEYGMAIRSLQYGLIGKADVVEFEFSDKKVYKKITPIEFKRGKQKVKDHDRIQLCAQALCLEEMFNTKINEGQIYYLQERRRSSVIFNNELIMNTKKIIKESRDLLISGKTPMAIYDIKKCDLCSLNELCMPKFLHEGGKKVNRYLKSQINRNLKDFIE